MLKIKSFKDLLILYNKDLLLTALYFAPGIGPQVDNIFLFNILVMMSSNIVISKFYNQDIK